MFRQEGMTLTELCDQLADTSIIFAVSGDDETTERLISGHHIYDNGISCFADGLHQGTGFKNIDYVKVYIHGNFKLLFEKVSGEGIDTIYKCVKGVL